MPRNYTLFDINLLSKRFDIPAGVPKGVRPSYNIQPGQSAPVITLHGQERRMERRKWGFIPEGAKNNNAIFRYKTHSAKAERIFIKPTWKEAIRTARCLVPANGFYEWHRRGDGARIPYYIHPSEHALFAFAGMYSTWYDQDGKEWGTYAIVTTVANDEMQRINRRMPVILEQQDEAAWLDPRTDDTQLDYLMRPYPDGTLTLYPVSKDINNPKNDSAKLIAPFSLDT